MLLTFCLSACEELPPPNSLTENASLKQAAGDACQGDGDCAQGLICNEGACAAACDPGERGCRCLRGDFECWNPDDLCIGGVCRERGCAPGELACACYANSTCNQLGDGTWLVCGVDHICREQACPQGSEGCGCFAQHRTKVHPSVCARTVPSERSVVAADPIVPVTTMKMATLWLAKGRRVRSPPADLGIMTARVRLTLAAMAAYGAVRTECVEHRAAFRASWPAPVTPTAAASRACSAPQMEPARCLTALRDRPAVGASPTLPAGWTKTMAFNFFAQLQAAASARTVVPASKGVVAPPMARVRTAPPVAEAFALTKTPSQRIARFVNR
jgi:hypothetical protein